MGATNEPSTRARIEIKVIAAADYVALHFWAVTGHSRSTRRSHVYTVRVPGALTRDRLPAVLRDAAAQLELHPLERWQPHP